MHEAMVERVSPKDTAPLRQRVLRPHQSIEELSWSGDDSPDTAVFAIRDESGEIVATGSVRRESPPLELAGLATGTTGQWRLRGMATEERLRGRGLGRRVLEECMGWVGGRGGGFLWCRARVGAREFYERAGFEAFGSVYEAPGIGPHLLMHRRVEPEGDMPGR